MNRYTTHSSAWTGRAPRSIESALGPHATDYIHDDDMHPHDRIVTIASAIVAVIAVALIAYGVIA